MESQRKDSTPQQVIHAHYSKWLEATARERSYASGVFFAREVTNLGKDTFEGFSEGDICRVIGCQAADWQSPLPPS